ncbi:hypothetical protein MPSEU_000044800 [Mayamaea pseudoterrestris]|nr:hypothetical protein MPSEU_000044800 [Mayamaea pseudoterrestris]
MRISINTLLLAASLLASSTFHYATAFPTGAGGCSGGGAAVQGEHLDGSKDLTSGSLEEAGFQVLLDGTQLSESDDFVIEVGKDAVLTLVATGGTPFKGVLMRVEASDVDVQDTAALTPSDNVQNAGVCAAPVGGVTHFNNDEKTSASATLRFDTATDVTLDVTVVVANDDSESIFYYQGFTGAAAGDAGASPGDDGTNGGDDAMNGDDNNAMSPTDAPNANGATDDNSNTDDDAPTIAPTAASPTMPPSMAASSPEPSMASSSPTLATTTTSAPSDVPSAAPTVPPGTPTAPPTMPLPTMEPTATLDAAGSTFSPTVGGADRDSSGATTLKGSFMTMVAATAAIMGLVNYLV